MAAPIDWSAVAAAFFGAITALGAQRVASRQTKSTERVSTTMYSLEERKILDAEARALRQEVREELSRCKQDNDRLESYIKGLENEVDFLKKKIRSFDYELWEWRSGRRQVGDPPPRNVDG